MKQFILIGLSLILFGSIGHGEETHPPPIILRQAKAKVMIEKIWFEKIGDKFESKKEIICTKETIIDVYETQKNMGLPFNDLKNIFCETKVNQKDFSVGVTPIIAETSDYDPMPILPAGQRLKSMSAILFVSSLDSKSRTQDTILQSFHTADLSLKSGFLFLFPPIFSEISCSVNEKGETVCQYPSDAPEAYFSAIVKFEDNL